MRFLRGKSNAALRAILCNPALAAAAVAFAFSPGVHAQNDPIDLSDVAAGNGGFVALGVDLMDHAGYSVSFAGDVNGDGLDDFVIGAYEGDVTSGYSNDGQAYVVFGKSDGLAVGLEDLENGLGGGFAINGREVSSYAGFRVSGAGDVNGDGLDDVIVGAYAANGGDESEAGEAYVVFGKSGSALVALADVLNGSGGFAIVGADLLDFAGKGVSGAGDVNGDGFDDVIVGAPYADPGGRSRAGESYVVFGKSDTETVLLTEVGAGYGGFMVVGVDASDRSGESVSGAGDVNGDGTPDLLIGARYAGKSYVVFGKSDGNVVQLSDVENGTGGFLIDGPPGQFGFAVSDAGDVNGDGLDDVIVGAWLNSPGGRSTAGESYVVFGKADGAAVDASMLSATGGGFAISGDDPFDASGVSVSGAGDVNRDGLDDLLVGANAAGSGGESYVVFGKSTATTVQLSVVRTGTGGFIIEGNDASNGTGISVSGGGDANGDGAPDFVIGSFEPNYSAGEAFVVFSPFDGDTVWVDLGHNGSENGSFDLPFNTLGEAVAAVPEGGTVKLKGDSNVTSSAQTLSISKAMCIEAFGGSVSFGSTQ